MNIMANQLGDASLDHCIYLHGHIMVADLGNWQCCIKNQAVCTLMVFMLSEGSQ
jgi:hypothetical protein